MDQRVKQPEAAPSRDIESALALDGKDFYKSRRQTVRHTALTALGTAAVGLLLLIGSMLGSASGLTYTTKPVERGAFSVRVSATGALQPLTQVEISSELSGVVRTVPVQENQRIKKGQVLAELDTVRVSAQMARAEAALKAAQAKVEDAEVTLNEAARDLHRTQRLAERGLAADQALEAAQAERKRAASALTTAKANLAIAKAELQLQQADLSKSSIHSPIDGIVLSRDVAPGQTVASSFQAPILFVIAEDLRRMELVTAIDEADIGSIKAGQVAQFTVDAFPNRRFEARISDVSYAPANMESIVTYEARLAVSNVDLLLRPGMTATVSIITRQDSDVLLVPNEALRYSLPEEAGRTGFSLWGVFGGGDDRLRRSHGSSAIDGLRTVYVLKNGAPRPVRVKTGDSDGTATEVLSGLSEGDLVITASAPADEAG